MTGSRARPWCQPSAPSYATGSGADAGAALAALVTAAAPSPTPTASTAAAAQVVDARHHLVEGGGVQRAEPLVDEQGVQVYSPGLRLDHVGQAEGQRKGGVERLAARQRRGTAVRPGMPVGHRQGEPGAFPPGPALVGPLQLITSR